MCSKTAPEVEHREWSGTAAAEVGPRVWSATAPEVRHREWGGTAAVEVGHREWSEWNSSSRGGTQRVE